MARLFDGCMVDGTTRNGAEALWSAPALASITRGPALSWLKTTAGVGPKAPLVSVVTVATAITRPSGSSGFISHRRVTVLLGRNPLPSTNTIEPGSPRGRD